jgi:DNA-binding transcriptional MerR regulator
MSNFLFLQNENARQLVDEILETLVRQYRIEPEVARKNIEDVFGKSKNLQKVFEKESSADKIKRTRAFKDALSTIKRNTYYGLRRYHADADDQTELIKKLENAHGASAEEIQKLVAALTASHASTKERIKDAGEFYEQLFALIGAPQTILDAGCGMQPLLFPFDALGGDFKLYLAADKDALSVSAIDAYARAKNEPRLRAVNWDIRENWNALRRFNDDAPFDVAFLFKLIPVVERQKPEYLEILRNTPAKTWVVTGSKISLTKNQSIERRERATIRRFIESTDCRTVAEFSVSEEFGFVLQKK